MASINITNRSNSTVNTVFGPVLVGQTKNFGNIPTATFVAALPGLGTLVAAGTIDWCAVTDGTGLSQGADVQNVFGNLGVGILPALGEFKLASGIGFDSAGAVSLSGAVALTGNVTMSGTLSLAPTVVDFPASPFTAATGVGYLCDATDGAIVFNLPDAGAGPRVFTVTKTDSTGNHVTITPSGGQTVSGASTVVLAAQYDTATLQSNGNPDSPAWYLTAKLIA